MSGGEPVLVDARGLLCPWPALRLARAAREMDGVGAVRVIADDPAAPRELKAMCGERGWRCEAVGEGEFLITLTTPLILSSR